MNPSQSVQQANVELVERVGTLIRTAFAECDEDLFSDDFVFHFFNPHLPDLAGDHHGMDGLASFFERLREGSETGFHIEPRSLTPFGDELVVANVTNSISFAGSELDFDAIVVWRAFDGRVHEAWDIPAINSVRLHEPKSG